MKKPTPTHFELGGRKLTLEEFHVFEQTATRAELAGAVLVYDNGARVRPYAAGAARLDLARNDFYVEQRADGSRVVHC
jgi:hypothetical protein